MRIWKAALIIFLISTAVYGCAKKEQLSEQTGLGLEGQDKDVVTQAVSAGEVIEVQPAAQPAAQPVQQRDAPAAQTAIQEAVPAPTQTMTDIDKLERNKQIQTALKNAGLYIGQIDGKIGPLTKKAIEEFQKSNGLKVDGKVG
ncbi:MAG: peptidoglycan-binding domain-containing protein, partial [Candidatus Omnitrophica bacterium]|nr:peptidoglycan-binding domain-containing protein [Candidatus Omnitrophota bacterium]